MTLRQTVTELFDSVPAGPVVRHFVEYSIAFCSRPKAANDIISGMFVRLIVPDKAPKLRDPGLNSSREIRPKTVFEICAHIRTVHFVMDERR